MKERAAILVASPSRTVLAAAAAAAVATKVELLTASDAAANVAHPDHARWVRDKRATEDAAWLRSVGIEPRSRVIDAKVDKGMQRLEARKREGVKRTPLQSDRTRLRKSEELALEKGDRLFRRPFQKRAAAAYECKRCGICLRCRREARAYEILTLTRRGDTKLRALAHDIIKISLRAQARIGQFEHLEDIDAARLITRVVEDVCDRSVPTMGNWRP